LLHLCPSLKRTFLLVPTSGHFYLSLTKGAFHDYGDIELSAFHDDTPLLLMAG